MIRINKDLNNVTARTRLESAEYRANTESSIAKRKGDHYQSARYGHSTVRDELYLFYNSKCGFCEGRSFPTSTPQVEHYRPKAKITSVNNHGYYWLGYEWSNLLLACSKCNGTKRNKFPLVANNHVVDHPIIANGNTDYTRFCTSSGYLATEAPLLINPELIDPEPLLTFNYMCELEARTNDLRAITTIREIGLNRDTLLLARQGKVNKIIEAIEEQIASYLTPPRMTEAQLDVQLSLIFKKIVERTNPESQFSLLGKAMIERFDELILEDIEPYFRRRIKDSLITYLQSI